MDFDAFSAGVEPGGLRNKSDIGVLICYILDCVGKPFRTEDLVNIIQENGLANYFETNSAIAELVKCKNIEYTDDTQEYIQITDNGKLISHQLNTSLSLSIRQKAIGATMRLVEKRKIEQENPVSIHKAEGGGYNVTFRITDGMRDLMSLTLFVPDLSEANAVKRNFHNNPERMYSIILAAVIGEKEMIDEALKELNK